jgi:spermidine synthase
MLQADPRVRVHVTDGRLFVKTTRSAFDVVIVNLPDPQNAQLNRFYTEEFFREVSQKLTPTGVFSFQLRSSENYISPELGQFLRTIHKSLLAVFPAVTAIPGETVHFFAARRVGILASGAAELLARLHDRNLRTSYVSEYFIPFRMMPDRMLDMEAQIRPLPSTPINRDFEPVAYYFDVALWSSQFNEGYRRVFRDLAGIRFGLLLAALGMLLAVLVVSAKLMGKQYRPRVAAGCCTAATGFTMIGLEMLLLLGFQAVYGYVYQQLAVVIAGFMAGMALGSCLAIRRAVRGMRLLAVTQILVSGAPFVVLGLLAAPAVNRFAFPAMALLCGSLGGFEFPLASRIFFSEPDPSDRSRLGALYAIDLAGSCLSAVLFSTWFVPIFGFLKTALLLAMVSIVPAILAMLPVSEADPEEGDP